MRYEMEKASIEKCTILRLNEEQVKLMSEPMGFWTWPEGHSQPIWIDLTNSEIGVAMTPQELFTQAKNLLRKIDTNEMSPDSKALYDKGMEYLDAIPEPGGGPETEETPDEDTVQPDEGTEGEEGEPQEIAPEGAESTVDSVMEEQLEEATEKALKDKPE